jgi:chromosomal replication initiator protein
MGPTNQEIWASVLTEVAGNIKPELVGKWLAELELTALEENRICLLAPSELHASVIEDHYRQHLQKAFQQILDCSADLEISYGETSGAAQPVKKSASQGTSETDPYNPAFTLETFVEGKPSRLALAACRAIVDRPGDLYNPLFLHGSSGTGKTHLMQALCRKLAQKLSVLYITADELSSRLAEEAKTPGLLRNQLRVAEVLAVEDVQYLQGRENSQEELFHAFNAIYNNRGQLLFSADMPPGQLQELPERLISRFTWGLQVEIEPPLFENRMEILASKAQARKIQISDDDLLQMASARVSSVRELEGMLARLHADSAARGITGNKGTSTQPSSPEDIKALISTSRKASNLSSPSSERIQQIVAAAHGFRPSDLLGQSRTRSLAFARHLAIYLTRELTSLSIQEIGGHFGGRDHSTINYAIKKMTDSLYADAKLRVSVDMLRKQIAGVKRG